MRNGVLRKALLVWNFVDCLLNVCEFVTNNFLMTWYNFFSVPRHWKCSVQFENFLKNVKRVCEWVVWKVWVENRNGRPRRTSSEMLHPSKLKLCSFSNWARSSGMVVIAGLLFTANHRRDLSLVMESEISFKAQSLRNKLLRPGKMYSSGKRHFLILGKKDFDWLIML